ncbi:hypothetical protein K439DRAFT_1376053, partial [Ramaria rubella]
MNSLFQVSKLTLDGSNWKTFKTHLMWAMAAWGVLNHLDRTNTQPTPPKTSTPTITELANHKTALTKWDQSKSVAHSQLRNIIRDAILVKILHCKSISTMWKTICDEYEGKTRMVSVDVCHRMMETRVSEGDNICVHLKSLALSHERLIGMGATLDAKDYATIILESLPPTYFDYVFNLSSSARILGKPLTAEQMISAATERYKSRKVQT